MAEKKNPAAVALGKLRAKKGPDMAATGALGGRPVTPTPCKRCGKILPTAREAWNHCLNVGSRKKAAAKKAKKK